MKELRNAVICLLLLAAVLAVTGVAWADLLYEQTMTLTKLELVRVDPAKNPGEDGAKRPSVSLTQRMLVKGEKMRITEKGGMTWLIELDNKTITRIDSERGVFVTLTIDEYASLRTAAETEVRKKKAANARFLLSDIMATIENMKDPAERERLKQNPPPMARRLQKIIDGVYEYDMKEPESRKLGRSGPFKALKQYLIRENKDSYLTAHGTAEVGVNVNKFFAALQLLPKDPAALIESRTEFFAIMEFPYDFPDETVKLGITVDGWAPAKLPSDLFTIPAGYRKVDEKFESILQKPKF